MKSIKVLVVVLIVGLVWSCGEEEDLTDPSVIVNKSIESHGLNNLVGKSVSFDFRGRNYRAERQTDSYIYYRIWKDSLGLVTDKLINSSEFSRDLGGINIEVGDTWGTKYSNSINSVLYFFQLPYGLNDPAVNKSFLGEVQVKGQTYYLIKVTFKQEQGGEDFQDEYFYWINKNDFKVDFLAYNYITEGGGVRFREAFNRREIGGMHFQDYRNYKPDSKTTPLEELDNMFEAGELELLSEILSENISVSNL